MFPIPKEVFDKVKLLNQPWVHFANPNAPVDCGSFVSKFNMPISKDILDAAKVAHDKAFNEQVKGLAGSMTIPQDILDAAEAIHPIQVKPSDNDYADLVKMHQAQANAVAESFILPAELMTTCAGNMASTFDMPSVRNVLALAEEFQRKAARAEAKRQLRRVAAKRSYEFSMDNLPDWIENRPRTAQGVTMAYLDFLDSIGDFDRYIDGIKWKGGT